MATKKQINYLSRDFQTVREDLINYLKTFFPDQWQDFNVASPGMALLELNAYVADLLSFTIDKKFNELFIDGVTEIESVYRLAKTFGFKIPGVRPSLTVVDIIIEVPSTANGPDETYLPVYRGGMKVRGAGQTFETVNDVDFSSDFSEEGIANRIITPILNGNQDLVRYQITKREKVKAGITKIFKKEITEADSKAFMEIILPEKNVLEISSVIVYSQLGITTTPTFTDFSNNDLRYWEVDELPENKVFVIDDTQPSVNGVKVGKYMEVQQRFKKEFLSDGSCKLTFGSGTPDYDAYDAFITNLTSLQSGGTASNNLDISAILDNTALGVKVPASSTMFIKYRIGGGNLSNVGSNVLQEVSDINAVILGADATLNQRVIASTKANNPIPAIGGAGLPNVEEVRNFIAANHAAQNRCVTLDDYISRIYQMPGKFGTVFRAHAEVHDNKVIFSVLSRDGSGKVIPVSTNIIKNNIVEYLAPFRTINDFIEINDGKVVDLQVEADLFIDRSFNASEVKANAIRAIANFFDIEKAQMNQNIYVSQITDVLRDVPGVLNIPAIRVYNQEGGINGYSETLHFQATGGRELIPSTGGFRTEIILIDNTLFGSPVSIFQIRFPDSDIKIRVA